MKMLVSGGAGFIGSNFIRYVLHTDPNISIVTLDSLTYSGSVRNLTDLPDGSRHELVQGDIRDGDLVYRLLRDHQIDSIIHLAAESHVDRSIAEPAPFVETNVVGTFSLLEAARRAWASAAAGNNSARKFLHVSTDEVYGSLDSADPGFRETTPYAPSSPYAASKAAADHLVRAYGHTYGLPIAITICSNNYGPRQFPEKLIPLMILNAMEGKPLPVYGDGQHVRDWLYVEDSCRALHEVLLRGEIGSTYNIGRGTQMTNLELVRRLCRILDAMLPESAYRPHEQLIRLVEDRPGHDRRYALDISKIHDELGWEPTEGIDSGLQKTVRWYLDHQRWVAAVRAQPSFLDWIEQNYAHRGEAS